MEGMFFNEHVDLSLSLTGFGQILLHPAAKTKKSPKLESGHPQTTQTIRQNQKFQEARKGPTTKNKLHNNNILFVLSSLYTNCESDISFKKSFAIAIKIRLYLQSRLSVYLTVILNNKNNK